MARRTSSGNKRIDVDRKVAFLRRADSYDEATASVDTIETHKSWVFLTDQFAYKLKKAIRYDSVDFRPPEARRLNCLEEVRLNRRLAEGVYLGVVPLTADSAGNLTLGGPGHPVDWLVKMRRLPREFMLDRKIRDGTLEELEIARLANKLACFYETASPATLDGERYQEMLLGEISINRRDLPELPSVMGSEPARTVIDAQLAFLRLQKQRLNRRVQDGHIVEGHGDLRPEHVCLELDPVIFDCLEFSPTLRTLDSVDELGFLSLQCERLGAAWIGEVLFETYGKVTGDDPPENLIRFYKSYRSATWARLAVWRARELRGNARTRWIDRGTEYLNLAMTYAESLA